MSWLAPELICQMYGPRYSNLKLVGLAAESQTALKWKPHADLYLNLLTVEGSVYLCLSHQPGSERWSSLLQMEELGTCGFSDLKVVFSSKGMVFHKKPQVPSSGHRWKWGGAEIRPFRTAASVRSQVKNELKGQSERLNVGWYTLFKLMLSMHNKWTSNWGSDSRRTNIPPPSLLPPPSHKKTCGRRSINNPRIPGLMSSR